MVILGAASGFSGGMLNPLQLVWHKPLLELPMFSGVYVQLSIYLS